MTYFITVFSYHGSKQPAISHHDTIEEAIEAAADDSPGFTYLHTIESDGTSARIVTEMDRLIAEYRRDQMLDDDHRRVVASPYLSGRV